MCPFIIMMKFRLHRKKETWKSFLKKWIILKLKKKKKKKKWKIEKHLSVSGALIEALDWTRCYKNTHKAQKKNVEKKKKKKTHRWLSNSRGGRSSVLKGIARKPPSGVWQCPERANHGQGRPISCVFFFFFFFLCCSTRNQGQDISRREFWAPIHWCV